MDVGDLATWSNTAVTTGALIAAFMVYRIESKRDLETARERHARIEVERRTQADKVAGWYGLYTIAVEGVVTTERPTYEWCAFVKNGSDLPIYDVEISYFFVIPDAPPGNVPGRRSTSEPISVVPPQQTEREPAPVEMLRQSGPDNQANYSVAIQFRDAAGVHWSRDIYGKLTELGAA